MARDDDKALRPLTFGDFEGQYEACQNLKIFVSAARMRGEPLDHVLFTGPPGTGKTTLAGIVANEMEANLVVLNAATLRTKGDLVAVLAGLSKNDVLFIDEIHALSPRVEEVLYTAMEDCFIDVASDGEAVRINLEPFTLIGATTVSGEVSQPLRDRFGEVVQMTLYSVQELSLIIERTAMKIGLIPSKSGVTELARRSRGTPRVANRLVRRARDFAQAKGHLNLDDNTAVMTCNSLGIDKNGLDKNSRKYMELLTARTTPMGLSSISSIIGEDSRTVESVIEPFLMASGFIEKTPSGRIATSAGRSAMV